MADDADTVGLTEKGFAVLTDMESLGYAAKAKAGRMRGRVLSVLGCRLGVSGIEREIEIREKCTYWLVKCFGHSNLSQCTKTETGNIEEFLRFIKMIRGYA